MKKAGADGGPGQKEVFLVDVLGDYTLTGSGQLGQSRTRPGTRSGGLGFLHRGPRAEDLAQPGIGDGRHEQRYPYGKQRAPRKVTRGLLWLS
jgi:hypothetical protein